MQEPELSKPSGRIAVLLVEDNAGDARLIEEALRSVEGPPFSVEWVQRLSEGIERLDQHRVDVVLLDLSLPDSQGLDTIITMHTHAPRVPILVLTGQEDEALAVEAVQEGAQDYLGKRHIQGDNAFLVRAIRYAIERKRVEETLTRLASFAERNPDPVIETDSVGAVTYLNPAAKSKFPDMKVDDTRHPVLSGLQAIMSAMRQKQQPSSVREIIIGPRVFEQHISYVPESNVLRSYLLDITERKQVEHLKDEFLSIVSHELRTPLATIKEFIAIIADQLAGPITEDQQKYLAIIKSNIDRLARMINDVLDMAKIESGRVVISKEVIGTGPILDHVVQSLKPVADNKRIELVVDAPKGPPDVFADADKITQVLINLVNNAIKFTPGPGRVTLSVDETESEIVFQVTDTGIGIEPKDLPKLFEKFQQFGRRSRESMSPGTGLGLAISKRFVELHGGRIWAESRPERGSTFSFTLPRYHVGEVFKDYLKLGISRAKQSQSHLSIITVAVKEFDHLKSQYGTESVLDLLTNIESRIRQHVRLNAGDAVVRWQSGDVIVILADMDRAGCSAVAQRVKQIVEARDYAIQQQDHHIDVLTHAATYPDDAIDEQEFLRLLERGLQTGHRPRRRLLVVDDEPKIRHFVKEILELQNYEVLTAASGPDALEQLKFTSVDLILLDVMMPVMDGYQVYHLLKENPRTRDIPVLIVTAQGERTDRLLGMESPSYNYVIKPFAVEELLGKIREMLEQHPSQVS